jgi:hypothetical protein
VPVSSPCHSLSHTLSSKTHARHNTQSGTSLHSNQSSPTSPSRSVNQRYSAQAGIPAVPPQLATSTGYRSPDSTYREHTEAPTYLPQPAQPAALAPVRTQNQTSAAQPGAPVSSAQRTLSTPQRSLEQIPWEPVHPRQSPVSTPSGSINSISRVPVGTRTSYPPKVQVTVSAAEVGPRHAPPPSGD